MGAHQVLCSNASASAPAQTVPDIHRVRCSTAEIAYKEQQEFYVEHDGGYMIPIHTKIGKEQEVILRKCSTEVAHSSLSRERSSQFPLEPRSEVCEQGRAVS